MTLDFALVAVSLEASGYGDGGLAYSSKSVHGSSRIYVVPPVIRECYVQVAQVLGLVVGRVAYEATFVLFVILVFSIFWY